MILKKSGAVTGDQRVENWLPVAIQEQLNGKLLADVAEKGIITPLKFKAQTVTYSGGADGAKSYDRVILQCKEGDVIVSSALSGELSSWANKLGDLVFNTHTSNRDNTTQVFRLRKPGTGSVTVTEKELEVGQKEPKATAA